MALLHSASRSARHGAAPQGVVFAVFLMMVSGFGLFLFGEFHRTPAQHIRSHAEASW